MTKTRLIVIVLVLILLAGSWWYFKGITPATKPLVISPTATISDTLTITTIVSTPDHAEIILDNASVGVTPRSFSNLSNSQHRLTLKKPGFNDFTVLFTPQNTPLLHFSLTPIDTATSPIPTPTADIDIIAPSNNDSDNQLADLLATDPNIPSILAGKISVPVGYRFPDAPDLNKITPLEIIPPALIQDPDTKKMPILDRSTLLANLQHGYSFDPKTQTIVANEKPSIFSLLNFGTFDPAIFSVPLHSKVSWFNQSNTACELRTDPKSPQRINTTLPVQGIFTQQLDAAGIYIFFCQGNPGPTQTISVS